MLSKHAHTEPAGTVVFERPVTAEDGSVTYRTEMIHYTGAAQRTAALKAARADGARAARHLPR